MRLKILVLLIHFGFSGAAVSEERRGYLEDADVARLAIAMLKFRVGGGYSVNVKKAAFVGP